MKAVEQKIIKEVGELSYFRGINLDADIDLVYKCNKPEGTLYEYEVYSHFSNNIYDVSITIDKTKIVKKHCTCPQFYNTGTCKHLAATLINYQDDLFEKKDQTLEFSKEILTHFYEPIKNNEPKIKKELKLEINLEVYKNKYYNTTDVRPVLKIGESKLYSLNSKLNNLETAIRYNENLKFGKDFTYNPDIHYFNEENQKIIDYCINLQKYSYYSLSNLTEDKLNSFLELLKNKDYTIIGYGKFHGYEKSNPLQSMLDKKEDKYILSLELKNLTKLTEKFYIYNDKVYKFPKNLQKLLMMLEEYQLENIIFEEKDLDLFKSSILPIVKTTIKIPDNLQDKIIIGVKPKVKIYLDYYKDSIVCNLKFIYKDEEISYFETDPKLVKDTEYEKQTLEDILKYGFAIKEKKLILEEIDEIGHFLTEKLPLLAEKYDVYTSQKIESTKIVKPNVKSNFSIGKDNIMSYSFDLGDIKNSEINNVLNSLKSKKRYYKLKNGNIIDLEENNQLTELEELIDDLNLSREDLKNGEGTIPKYRALYVASKKNNKNSIIETNNIFDAFINNFNSYKNQAINLTAKDNQILRDYQVEGIKWLYNIYKCDFGGVLADEMGLGKSVQLIYLIKQIIKEKKDAKILIIAPTSLVYNWQHEFEKFGKELSYQVYSENKQKRKEMLENSEDINIYITTYGLVRQDKDYYKDKNFELIAIDEAQNIKNQNAQMTKIIKRLNGNCKIALTGTPLENSVSELWSIFDFLMPGYLGNSTIFNQKYNIKDTTEESVKKLETLKLQIEPFMLRRKKKDVIKDLPDKIENNVYIDLDKKQKEIYLAQLNKTKKEMDELIKEEGFTKARFKILQLLTKLRQICIDPAIIFENYKGSSAKIDNLVNLVKEIVSNNHKILIFTSFKTALDIVNKKLKQNNITTYTIDGSISSKKRMELVNKFNSDNTNVFLITLKSGGTGLNLTSADVVIHLDLWWNPQVENQATDRTHRIGQKNTVEVIKLICKGTIEEHILDLQQKKKFLSDNIIESENISQNVISKLTEKDLKKLLSYGNEEE